MYIKPQYRIGPYIVGLLLGYYLVVFQKYGTQKRQRSAEFQAIGWICASFACFWAIFGLYPALQVEFHSTSKLKVASSKEEEASL